MNRRLLIFILLVNLFATAEGLWVLRPRHHNADRMTGAELKWYTTVYLASVTTPEDMKAKSAEIARIMILASHVVEGWHALFYRTMRYIVLLGTFNIVSIGIGMWLGRTKPDAKPAMQRTAPDSPVE